MFLTFMANDKQFGFLTSVVLFTGMNVERFITNPSTRIHITGLVHLSEDIIHLTREMQIRDAPGGAHAALERAYPSGEEGTGARSHQPPAAGLISRQQDTYFIPPPSRAVGGARGRSVPVSTATLGLIHRQDPALAALLREEPQAMMSQRTRLRVYSTMRLIRTGLIGQMASLQQWEDAMLSQDE